MAGSAALMLALANRVVKKLSDVTIGTAIVLVHVAIADRQRTREATRRQLPN